MKFIKQVCSFWKETWEESRVLFYSEAIGALASAAGAITLVAGTPTPNLWVAYILYTIGSTGILISSYLRNSAWLVLLMMFFICMNLIGIWRLF